MKCIFSMKDKSPDSVTQYQYISMAHLGSQKSCQVDLRDHLAAAVTLLLVSMLMVLHQVPNLDPTLQVRSDHGSTGTQAVGASSVLDHVFCKKNNKKTTSGFITMIYNVNAEFVGFYWEETRHIRKEI